MGYTTEFEGEFKISPNVSEYHVKYIKAFNETRRMKRDSKICETLPDPIRLDANLPVGEFGEYFVGGTGFAGQGHDASVLDHNNPSRTQPGLWCGWTIENNNLVWDGVEKFYYYTEWLEYLIKNFFQPWGYTLNGIMSYQGEEEDDFGNIVVENNVVSVNQGSD